MYFLFFPQYYKTKPEPCVCQANALPVCYISSLWHFCFSDRVSLWNSGSQDPSTYTLEMLSLQAHTTMPCYFYTW